MRQPIQISTTLYQSMKLLFLLSGNQISLHVHPMLSTYFDSSVGKNKRKNFWFVQIYNFPCILLWVALSSGFGPDYDVILPADILPIPVMLPPIAVILSPVIF